MSQSNKGCIEQTYSQHYIKYRRTEIMSSKIRNKAKVCSLLMWQHVQILIVITQEQSRKRRNMGKVKKKKSNYSICRCHGSFFKRPYRIYQKILGPNKHLCEDTIFWKYLCLQRDWTLSMKLIICLEISYIRLHIICCPTVCSACLSSIYLLLQQQKRRHQQNCKLPQLGFGI